MEQADDTLSDISDLIKTLTKGKEDDLSVKGTYSLFKLIFQTLECLFYIFRNRVERQYRDGPSRVGPN